MLAAEYVVLSADQFLQEELDTYVTDWVYWVSTYNLTSGSKSALLASHKSTLGPKVRPSIFLNRAGRSADIWGVEHVAPVLEKLHID